MWLENLKALKAEKRMSTKQIAEKTNLPERTVARIFSGDTDRPYVDTLHRIVTVLDSSLDDILAGTPHVVVAHGGETADIEAERAQAVAEREALKEQVNALTAENAALRVKVETLRDKVDTLKDELIETHKYYNKR